MSIKLQANFSLKPYNTFGFDQRAEFFCDIHDDDDLEAAVAHAKHHKLDITILGGGSNLVLTRDVAGLVIHPANKRVEYRPTDKLDTTIVCAGAGLDWNDLVLMTLHDGLQGLENLTLIPGSVGAAPVQNIGAYGVEVGQRIHSVRAFHLPSQQWQEFTPEQCQFSYRNSYFKLRPCEYLISEVRFRLGRCHHLTHEYDSLRKYLEDHQITNPTAIEVSKAVAAIRSSRLPDPDIIGNAGSFFHNPVVSNEQARHLKTRFEKLPVFPAGEDQSKLSAAWLIDNAGFKGQKFGNVGVYDKQALVLVNHGDGNGVQLLELAKKIQQDVKLQYNVELRIEPTVI